MKEISKSISNYNYEKQAATLMDYNRRYGGGDSFGGPSNGAGGFFGGGGGGGFISWII